MKNTKEYFLKFMLIFLIKTSDADDHDERHSFGNIVNASIEITGGLIKNIVNDLPTPKEVFEGAKQLIAGYPATYMVSVFNEICYAAFAADAIKPEYWGKYSDVTIQLHTACKTYYYEDYYELIFSNEFDKNKNVVILATGWQTNPNDTDIVRAFSKAFACRGDVNFLVLDAAEFIDTLFTWSAYNSFQVGYTLGTYIYYIKRFVPDLEFHLIGHSLGAQIMGTAARYYTLLTDEKISRVTGLDPSNRCFAEGQSLESLYRGDAKFVDIIHSNPDVLGQRNPIGDVDFYPNGLSPLAPGCLDVICSHQRSWMYFVESIYPNNANNFLATRCNSLENLRHGKCASEKYPMGYNVPLNLKGNYFLEVNGHSPFGEFGDEERENENEKCGLCENK